MAGSIGRQVAGGRGHEPGARRQVAGARSQEPGAGSWEPGGRRQEATGEMVFVGVVRFPGESVWV